MRSSRSSRVAIAAILQESSWMSRLLAVASFWIVSSLVGVVALVGGCGGGSTQEIERPKPDVTKSLPATLEAQHPRRGDPRALRVHVYADTGVRALPHWK